MKVLKKVGIILFILTLATPLIAFSVNCKIGESDIFSLAGAVMYSWVMWFFLPIPIASIFVGKKLKRNKLGYRKNYIAAIACSIILLLFGSYRFIFTNIYYDTDVVFEVEVITSLNLPDNVKSVTEEYGDYSTSYVKILKKEEVERLENEIEQSELWKSKLALQIKALLPTQWCVEFEGFFDCFCFYNITDGEYNKVPTAGEFECVFIGYDYDLERLLILNNYTVKLD